jgi:anti-sigma B factor antagonist
MSLICNQDRLLKIFRITGLAKVFTIYPDETSALSA